MKKVIYNISLITILAVPCLWVLSDSVFMQFLGLVYAIAYVKNIIIPVAKVIRQRLLITHDY